MRVFCNPFLAKSKPKETIQEHTIRLLENFNMLRDIYPDIKHLNWDILRLACLYHDLGKMNTKFQNKLGARLKDYHPEIDEIYHNFLSPAYIPKKKLKSIFSEQDIRILYQAVYYHHYRPEPELIELQKIIKEDLNRYIEEFDFYLLDKSEGLYSSFKKQLGERITWQDDIEIVYKFITTKGLLNKIDYAASAHIPIEIRNDTLSSKLHELFEQKFTLNDMQKYMLKSQDQNNIIIASTGLGKTEAALLWLGNNKGFFTLPLRVSINAIYDRIKEEIKFEDVALLHSNSYSEYLKRAMEKNIEMEEDFYTKTKQLSMPLTVCTLDQLIDFVFKYDGYEMKLATLSYSKLIIDEIQMYSPEMVAYLIVALKYITEMGGKFSILTATLPSAFLDLLTEYNIPYSNPQIFLTDKIRHRVKVIEDSLNIEDILNRSRGKKVLVIVNTVKKAQEIYQELINDDRSQNIEVNLLHSRFIRKDRRDKEERITEMGQASFKGSGIWISTQIVEASLDIDFDILFTELSDLSGLFQRMGRIFRKRELDMGGDEPNIYVYVGNEQQLPSGITKSARLRYIDYDIFSYSKAEIMKYDAQFLREKDKIEMINNVYSTSNLKDTNYLQTIKETINYVFGIPDYYLEKDDIKLRDIANETVIPLSTYEENVDKLGILINDYNNMSLNLGRAEREKIKNEILEYTVDLPIYMTKGRKLESIYLGKTYKIYVGDFNYDYNLGITPKDIDISEDNFF